MRIRRRSLRKLLLAVGFLIGSPTIGGTLSGGVLILLGGALHLWSKGCLEQNRRLITAGPYRFTRNPFYLANALIDAGLCVVIGHLWLGLGLAVLWTIAYRDTIAGEEATLRSLFPVEFDRYAAQVPRFLPNGRRVAADAVTGSFSLDNDGLARGQEYARLLGIAIGPAVIWAGAAIRGAGFEVLTERGGATLALLAAIPAAWVVKLALAEIFRRPDSVLVPGLTSQPLRAGVATTLGISAVAAWTWQPWVTVLSGMWLSLVALDALRVHRSDVDRASSAPRWRYLVPVSAGSLVAASLLAWVGATAS